MLTAHPRQMRHELDPVWAGLERVATVAQQRLDPLAVGGAPVGDLDGGRENGAAQDSIDLRLLIRSGLDKHRLPGTIRTATAETAWAAYNQ
ncbi:MAG: hypothetical protein ACRDNK_00505 [Solirubrobacteraceae bacterium]